jgi:hypothetical protein
MVRLVHVLCAGPFRIVALLLMLGVPAMSVHAATATPVITSPTTANGTLGVAFSYQITATEDPTSFTAAGLPAGLSFNSSTGLISGTPTSSGSTTVAIGASNAFGTGVGSVNITISGGGGAPVISSPTTASATVGTPFTYQIVASNSPISYAAANLPSGLSISTSTGLISGTPTVAGTWTATIEATNLQGTNTASLDITVADPNSTPGNQPQITSSLNVSGRVGTPFTYTIVATNTPTSFSATSLPGGLSVDSTTGVISGTPTSSAVFNVTISATNANGTDSETLRLTIADSSGNPPPGATPPERDSDSCGVGSGLSALLLAALWAVQALCGGRRRAS